MGKTPAKKARTSSKASKAEKTAPTTPASNRRTTLRSSSNSSKKRPASDDNNDGTPRKSIRKEEMDYKDKLAKKDEEIALLREQVGKSGKVDSHLSKEEKDLVRMYFRFRRPIIQPVHGPYLLPNFDLVFLAM